MSGEEQVPVTEELVDNADQGRFELYRGGDVVGWLYYTHLKPNRYALLHTEVEPSHQRQGVKPCACGFGWQRLSAFLA
jgi:predicted GNAT family acetyltransferase